MIRKKLHHCAQRLRGLLLVGTGVGVAAQASPESHMQGVSRGWDHLVKVQDLNL